MKRIIYPALRSIFLTQQRLADDLAIPPPQGWLTEPGMRLKRLELAAARLGFQAMRKVIRPELRSQFRILARERCQFQPQARSAASIGSTLSHRGEAGWDKCHWFSPGCARIG